MVKYIVVCGGVISGIGKGVLASSTGLLMKSYGFRVTALKIDPYINIDAGTMSPLDHGEVFVLDDGGEVDLDLGNYERFLDVTLTRDNNITTGKIYRQVIEQERKGEYLGKTVQVIPHITNSIQDWVERVSKIPVDGSDCSPDVCIVELGGTVGDIESAPFIEAMRQFQFRVGPENFFLMMVSLVPVVGSVGEQKTKPTQACVRDLRGLGLYPDLIACRSARPLDESIKSKISMFCHVAPSNVISVHDCKSVYDVPFLLVEQGIYEVLEKKLCISRPAGSPWGPSFMEQWKTIAERQYRAHDTTTIVLVGKYTNLQDSYISVVKSLTHAAIACNRKLKLEWVEAADLEPERKSQDPLAYHNAWKLVCGGDGILIPGGFGQRGTEGKILAAQWARENKIPFFGICLGLQVVIIEFARNVLGLANANSEELDKDSADKVVVFMPEISKTHLGGTMRLGSRATVFSNNNESIVRKLYDDKEVVYERHRHRYEVNTEYRKRMADHGLVFTGEDETGERMEVVELQGHPYYVATQYHPEYKSRPLKPSPPFLGLLQAASKMDIQAYSSM
eukprot:Partr_v1_DN26599_c0_g1_i2_m3444 putative ctp synthase